MYFRAKNTLKNNHYHILKHPLKRVWIKNAVKCCLFYHKRPRSRIHKGDKRVYTNLSLPLLALFAICSAINIVARNVAKLIELFYKLTHKDDK
jgi:hypothetical protein